MKGATTVTVEKRRCQQVGPARRTDSGRLGVTSVVLLSPVQGPVENTTDSSRAETLPSS